MKELNKTKIIATYGPRIEDFEVLKDLVLSGVNVVRINSTHSSFEQMKEVKDKVDKINEEYNYNAALMIDTRGSKFRGGVFKDGKVNLEKNSKVKLLKDSEFIGNEKEFSIGEVFNYLKLNDEIRLNDGVVKIKIIEVFSDYLIGEVVNPGEVRSRSGINIKNCFYEADILNEKDKVMIKDALTLGFDFISLSFIQTKEDVLKIKDYIKSLNIDNKVNLIVKVETYKVLSEIDDILDLVDGIMIARGDLALETNTEDVPLIQKRLLKKAKIKNKIGIVATEMLKSMETFPCPTRAELTDVTNAVFDMADAIMLSSETSIGMYPFEAVSYMKKLSKNAENATDLMEGLSLKEMPDDVETVVVKLAVLASMKLNPKVILVPTRTGRTARLISSFRQEANVVAVTNDHKVMKELAICFGVNPVYIESFKTIDQIISDGLVEAKKMFDLNQGDIIVALGGSDTVHSDFIKVVKID